MVRFLALLSLALVGFFFGAGEFKSETRKVKSQLAQVERDIAREDEKIRILKAEWAHRTEPATLRRLAEAHLGLAAVRIEQIAAIEDVPYLGMDLDDEEFEAVPVEFATAPRQKPSQLLAAADETSAASAEPAPTVEYVVADITGITRLRGRK